MERSQFDQLLDRYAMNEVSQEERQKIDAWLSVMRAEKESDLILSKEDEQRLYQKLSASTTRLSEITAFRPAQQSRSLMSNPIIRIAAALVLLFAISAVIWYSVNNSQPTEIIAISDQEKVILNDSSIIWLHKNAKLTYDQSSDRHVALSGEALFEVAKDAEHPFTISCGEVTVRVVGTSFNLRTTRDNIELHVLTGKVNISSSANRAGVDVLPNEAVVYASNGTVERIQLDEAAVANITENTGYNMHFSNTPMEEVLERITNKFNVKVKVENTKLLQCRVTADFTDQSLNATLSMLKDMLDFDYKISSGTITMTGNGCP